MGTGLQPISEREYGGYTLGEWRDIARAAMAAVQQNPDDQEAAVQLQIAQNVIRGAAGQIRGDVRRANLGDTEAATDPGALRSAVLGFGQGASLGFADELAGALTALRGQERGESFGTAYRRGRDLQRGAQTAGEVFHPFASAAGDVGGALASFPILAAGAARFVPQAARAALTAGGRAGASLGEKATSALLGATASGAYGGVSGFARGEEGLAEDVEGAIRPAAVGFGLALPATALGQALARRSAVNAANEVRAVRAPEQQAAQIAADQERATLYRIRREEAEALRPLRLARAQRQEANEASLTALRQQRAQQGVTIGEQRVTDIPLNRQMLEDRSVLLALRRAAAEARKAGNPTSVEGRFRAHLARIGTPPEAIEQAVARARVTPGSGITSAATPSVVTPPQTVVPQRGATRAQLAYRQARTRGEPLPEPDVVRPGGVMPSISASDADIAELGQALPALIQGPVTPTMMEVVTDGIGRASPAARQALWADVQAQWAGMPDSWRSFLATLLRPAGP